MPDEKPSRFDTPVGPGKRTRSWRLMGVLSRRRPKQRVPLRQRMTRDFLLKLARRAAIVVGLVVLVLLPFNFPPAGDFLQDCTVALAYVVMALGLNIVVGFAGLLDLGYVAFFAIGAYTVGWFGSGFFANLNHQKGVHFLVSGIAAKVPGLHINFLIILVIAMIFTALAGVLIGLPTLRLRGDYIAIVTLAFGEIIGRVAVNGDSIVIRGQPLTAGRQGITPVDPISLPGLKPFGLLDVRPWYWFVLVLVFVVLFVNFRLRDSRLGRAWIALREDEVAAVAMGVPSVKTKLMAYGTGAAFGGVAGAFLGSFLNTVNADQFQFYFSILVLGMVILGGMGSIWGVVVGAVALSFINNWFIPNVLNDIPGKIGINFDATQLTFGIYCFLLVMMMLLRPQGLLPERRRKLELADHVGTGETEESVFTARV
jgi:branched-chain amino acid transport system permease protein